MRRPVMHIAENVRHRQRLDELHARVCLRQLLIVNRNLDIRGDVQQPEVNARDARESRS